MTGIGARPGSAESVPGLPDQGSPGAPPWEVRHVTGPASEHHETWPAGAEDRARRLVAVRRVTRPAIVLGSTQPITDADPERAAAAGIDVVRRRTGGGAVLVVPGDPVWIDVWVPRPDPLWEHDVVKASFWLGDAWASALRSLDFAGVEGAAGAAAVGGVAVHRGPLVRSPWSDRVCFAGLGPGEVVDARGRKVVGLAQRRSRDGAWFHTACTRRWDPASLLDVLGLAGDGSEIRDGSAGDLPAWLASRACGVEDLVGGALSVDEIEQALITALSNTG